MPSKGFKQANVPADVPESGKTEKLTDKRDSKRADGLESGAAVAAESGAKSGEKTGGKKSKQAGKKAGRNSGARDARRDPATGRFMKGYRGGGRPRLPEELKEAFRAAAPEALRVLVQIVNDEDAKHGDRIRAAEVILDRGYGKPVQAVDVDASSIPQVVFVGDVPD